MTRDKLHAIQFARFAAALLVLFYHSGRMLPTYMTGVPRAFTFGRSGLDFFFVLSGFIIAYAHGADIGRPAMLSRYIRRRLTRIYPIYWIVTATMIAFLLLLGHPEQIQPLSHLIASVLLIPDGREPILGVAWTLTHEMLFYLVFATLIVSARIGGILFAAWGLLMLVGALRPMPAGPLAYIAQSWHLEFLLGMGAAWLAAGDRVAAPPLLLGAGFIGFTAAALLENAGWLDGRSVGAHLAYGFASALIVVGLARAKRGRHPMLESAALRLGAWSYVLYLVHVPVIAYLAHALFALGLLPYISGAVAMVLCAAAAVLVAALIHRWVESPLGAWLQIRRTKITAAA